MDETGTGSHVVCKTSQDEGTDKVDSSEGLSYEDDDQMRMMTSWDQRGIGRNEFVRLSGLRVDLRSEQNPLRRRRRPVHRLRHHQVRPHLVLPLRVRRTVVVPQSERRGRRGSPSPAKRGVERRNGKGRKRQRPSERNERPLSDKKSSRKVRTMAIRTQAHSTSGPRRSLIGSG